MSSQHTSYLSIGEMRRLDADRGGSIIRIVPEVMAVDSAWIMNFQPSRVDIVLRRKFDPSLIVRWNGYGERTSAAYIRLG
jgi:hypothetical protein